MLKRTMNAGWTLLFALAVAGTGVLSAPDAHAAAITINSSAAVNGTIGGTGANKTLTGTITLTAAAGYAVASASITQGTTTTDVTSYLTGWNSTDRSSSAYHQSCSFTYGVSPLPTYGNNDTITINAIFKPLYAVTTSVSTGTGTITGSGALSAGTSYWLQGESPQLIVTAGTSPRYGIQSVAVGSTGQTVTSLDSMTVNIANITQATSVTASFARAWTITPSITGPTGAITPALPSIVLNGGNSTSYTITAATGSVISDVVVDGTSLGVQASPYTYHGFISVTGDHTIQAVFTTPPNTIMNYCNKPPFLSMTLKPNLLLMLDNSASMLDLAYTDPDNTYCYDNSFSSTGTYYGYFAAGANYSYDFVTNKFTPGATRPGSCAWGTSYFCINTNADGTVHDFWATANFLNWLSASKLDQEKAILTGGHYDTTNQMLIAESRGCVGRRYIKEIPAGDWTSQPTGNPAGTRLTFGTRGPYSYDPDYVSQATAGGETRIEIFKGNYDADHCLAAVVDWSTATSLGGVQQGGTNSNTDQCMNSTTNLKSAAFNAITHLCYRYLTGGNLHGNMNVLQNDCASIYAASYGNNPANITNQTGGDAICASTLPHPLFNSNDIGFLGQCWTAGSWDDDCSVREVQDYCAMAHIFDVTDPSDAQQIAGGTSGPGIVPSFIMDAGLAALGSPIATLNVHVTLTTAPTHLIQEFKDVINFGTAQYNMDGSSATECSTAPGANVPCQMACQDTSGVFHDACFKTSDCASGQTCAYPPHLEGAKVTSYIDYTPTGDHTTPSSLIYNIDNLTAGTWTPLAEAYYNTIGYFANRSDMRLNVGVDGTGKYDYDVSDPNKNPSRYVCRQNYTLIISDGGSTVDQNGAVNTLAGNYGTSAGVCANPFLGSKNVDDLVKLASTKKIQSFALNGSFSEAATKNNESILTYAIFTGKEVSGTDQCVSPSLLMDAVAAAGGTSQATAYRARDYASLETSLRNVFAAVASRVTSGTAASILSNSEGSGANILQAIFYPVKTFDNLAHTANWIGELQNFWYYIDPFIGNSTIREDTDGDLRLNLINDYEAQFNFNSTKNQTEVKLLQDTNGDGAGDTPPNVTGGPGTRYYRNPGDAVNWYVSSDDVNSLWRAGRRLWMKDASSRTIYTELSGSLVNFDSTSLATNTLAGQQLLQATNQYEADNVIAYVRGDDTVNGGLYRQRGLVIPSVDNVSRVWKLGDVINSTPRVQSPVRNNNYDIAVPSGYGDASYAKFIASASYQNRGMAYVGSNDGMLHAFKLGKLDTTATAGQKAQLLAGDSGVIGGEEWAFVPKNALPYLKYLSDPLYPHIFFVDGTPLLIDASIGKPSVCDSSTNYWDCLKDTDNGTNWKSILVEGMGLGGACRNSGTACNASTSDCVNTPVSNVGYSSYFALDVTNQTFDPVHGTRSSSNAPTLLWEFSHPELGYATAGPAIVRIAATSSDGHGGTTPDPSKNGRWFAVFASGPTGPIDKTSCQFQGKSDQNLKIFVVDLQSGVIVSKDSNGNPGPIDTGIPFAFAGSITNGVIDTDRWNPNATGNYQDDAIYISYVKRTGAGTVASPYAWTDGGVLRLTTKESLDVQHDWRVHTVIDGIGAVSTNIAKLQDRKNHNLWLFFGTGRYFYNQDDMATSRQIFGIRDLCYNTTNAPEKIDPDCDTQEGTPLSPIAHLTDKTSSNADTLDITGSEGWFINLQAQNTPDNNFGAERVTTDPVAMTNGAVFFTTFKPTGDPCQFGGKSFIWGVKYNTGAPPPAAALTGKALVQVSTGSFQQIDLKNAFNDQLNRRTNTLIQGKPPIDPPPVVSNSNLKPVKKIIHMQER